MATGRPEKNSNVGKKQILLRPGDKSVSYVSKSDISANLQEEKHAVPSCIDDFVRHHAEENLISKLAKKHSVQAKYDGLSLEICGTKENIKQFRQSFKESYTCDTITLDIQSDLISDHLDELVKIADSCKCCIQMKKAKDKEVASWSCPGSLGKVTLCSGHMEDSETDFRIVFVTDKLAPLHKTSQEEIKEYVRDTISSVTEASEQMYVLGQSLDYRIKDNCKTKAVVVSKSNSTAEETDCISFKMAKASLLGILTEAKGCNAKSIAVQVSLRDEKLTKVCTSAVLSVHKELSQFKTFIFCDNNDVAKTAQRIDDTIRKESPGYFRETHMGNLSLKRGSNNISIQVEIGSLVEWKADVLVNAVHSSLDLKKGKLSNLILEKGGKEIQGFCTRHYPDGIELGDIAVTPAGNLHKNGVKWIFHCALPPFKKATFVKNIKSIVRKCLCEMSKRGMKKVAFPALGTGNLGYPTRDTAKAMFDAVEEHRKNFINSSVKQVSFVLHPADKNTGQVFFDEEVRQKSKRGDNDKKQSFPKVLTDVGFAEGKVRLTVAKGSVLSYFSSTVVVVDTKFKKGQKQKRLELKPSSKEPKSWNDCLKVVTCNGEDMSSLVVAVASVLEYCTENKISDILIPTYKEFKGTAVDQIKVILQEVQQYLKDNTDSCLQNVFISVPDSDSLDDIEKKLNSGHGSPKDSSHDGGRWRLIINESLVDFKVVGKTIDSVRQAANKLQDYVYSLDSSKKILESTGEIPETFKTHLKSPEAISKRIAAQELPLVNNEMLPQDQSVPENDNYNVSAEINPGITQHLKEQNMLKMWKEVMQSTYHLEFLQKENGVVVAIGSFDAIISFEQHLESNIMDIANVPYQVLAAHEKQDNKQQGNHELKQGALGAVNDVQQKEITGHTNGQRYLQMDDKDLQYQQYQTGEVMKNYTAYTSKCTLSINGLEIALYEGDITTLPADCIVMYSNENLEEVRDGKGLLVHVPCQNSRQACYICTKVGELNLYDHCTKHGGNLPCKEVLYALGQALSKKDLKDALEMCLEEATRLNCSSVSVPVMLSETKDESTDCVVVSYIEVVESFSEHRNGLSVVNIVVCDPLKIDTFTKGFISVCAKRQTRNNKHKENSEINLCTQKELDFLTEEGIVKIVPVLGNIETVEVSAVVSTEDKTISGKSKIAKAFLKLGSESYTRELAKLKAQKAKVGSVFEMHVTGGQFKCQYVFHTIVPRRNRAYCNDTFSFEKDIRYTIKSILEKASDLKCDSLALPLIGTSEDIYIPTPVETCCKAMFEEITQYLTNNGTSLKYIFVVSPEKGVVQAFGEQMKTDTCVKI